MKSTAAVILVSAAALPPWGDDGWRFAGAMQVVHDGPDWLYAQWPTLDGTEHHESHRFATMVLREDALKRAADIAVMTYALLQVPEWHQLKAWWEPSANRDALVTLLDELTKRYAGAYKLAVVHTAPGVEPEVLDRLRTLGFEVVEFAETERVT